MKKATSIALILLLSMQCFYKLSVIAYFEMNREYIAQVLCINKEQPITMCYGQCFLKTNLDLADRMADESGATAVGKLQFEFPAFLVSAITMLDIHFSFGNRPHIHHPEGTPSNYSNPLFQPPAIQS